MNAINKEQMNRGSAFILIIRFCFVVFSVIFAVLAAGKWDKYLLYMKFMDFLPDLSLSFIVWTAFPLSYAVSIWAVSVSISWVFERFLSISKLENIIILIFITFFPLYIKQNYFSGISVSNLLGLSHLYMLLIGAVLAVLIVWITRRHGKDMLSSLDSGIGLIVWFLIAVFILAVPLSFIKNRNLLKGNIPVSSMLNSPELSDKPNIIIISWDTLTALDMQLYGYERKTTPFISRFAEDAAVFTKAYSASNWTTPVILSLMTSQRPWTHRIWYQAAYSPVDDFENNLPSILNGYGYECYSFIQTKHADPNVLGLKNAFFFVEKYNTLQLPFSSWYKRFSNQFIKRPVFKEWFFGPNPPVPLKTISDFFSNSHSSTLYQPDILYDRFLQYLKKRMYEQDSDGKVRPFFAWLHLRPPHQPYLPPKPFMGSFNKSNKYNTDVSQYTEFDFYKEYDDEEQKNIDILRSRYDEFILYSDSQFEKFLGQLSDTVDMTNTIIIFTADHGESFSHNYLAHRGPDLYEPLVHVPLVIKLPERFDNELNMNGKFFDAPVETIDIAPTILRLADIPVPEWMDGRALTGLVDEGAFQYTPVYSMRLTDNSAFGEPITKGTVAVWDGSYKLVYYLEDEKSLLYNLKDDPGETTDISGSEHDVAERLLGLIKDNIEKSDVSYSKLN